MPTLIKLDQNQQITYFVDESFSKERNSNVMTILIGKNAIGKSRLLRGITIDSLKNDLFDRVIAISNTQYHKFPNYRDVDNGLFNSNKYIRLTFDELPFSTLNKNLIQKNKNDQESLADFIRKVTFEDDKHNINFMSTSYLPRNTLFSSIAYFFMNRSEKPKNFHYKIYEILSFLGLDLDIWCGFRINNNRMQQRELIYGINYIILNNSNKLDSYEIEILKNSIQILENKRNITFNIFKLDDIEIQTIAFLLELNLLRINTIKFSKNHKKMHPKELSSGELSVLSLIISLVATLENNSLICIDEPEINLHPEWQGRIIELIELVATNYYGCHFFIATHSPQVISGIKNNNSFILDLAENKVHHIDKYQNRSSDFQLTEIFNFPGNNNEYLIRQLLVILNKLNSDPDYYLEYESLSLLEHVRLLINTHKINQNDKVIILFNLINDWVR